MKKIIGITVSIAFFSFCSNVKDVEIKAPGIVDGNILSIKSMVSGQVEKIEIEEGDRVEKYDLLIKINSDKTKNKLKELSIAAKEIEINTLKLEKRLKLFHSNVAYLKNQVQRFKRLKKRNSISGEKLESMELKLMEAETSRYEILKSLDTLGIQTQKNENRKEYLQLIMKDHRVKSPVKGIVLEKFISEGENIFPNSPLVDILDSASLYVEIFIEEQEMACLRLGQRARIIVDGLEEKELTGVVSYFGKKAEFSPKYVISEKERKSLLYEVKIAIDRENDLFKIGMTVTIILNKK